jgi:lipoprotein-anchoring transpeptidase ErfK/SrfK
MAKGSYYGRKKRYTRRRILLAVALLVVVAAAIAKLSSVGGSPEPMEGDRSDLGKAVDSNGELSGTEEAVAQGSRAVEPAVVATAEETAREISPVVTEVSAVRQSSSSAGAALLVQGRTALAGNDYIVARDKLSEALAAGLSPGQEAEVRQLLNGISDVWLFSRNLFGNDTKCSLYKVVPGDRLVGIGKKHHVPYQLLLRINNIDKPEKLQAGQTIKVVHGPFHAEVDREKFVMSVYLGDIPVRSYAISTGSLGRDTPTGLWRVKKGTKLVNPEWTDPDTGKKYYPDDPQNPLGERWIGLEGLEGDTVGRTGFGIHGTIEPESIGTRASRGCIRLLNEDVIELFDLLIEGDSRVRVIN